MHKLQLLAGALGVALLASPSRAQTVLQDHVLGRGFDDGALTPDGRWGVLRENSPATTARIYDLTTGAELHAYVSAGSSISGTAQDAAVATNERAAVLGSSLMLFDVTALPALSVVADAPVGTFPRDLDFTPDGQLLAVRGGAGPAGGLFVFDAVSGAQLLQAPGQPQAPNPTEYSFDVDSVAVTDEYAVFTSLVEAPGALPRTRVTIVELRPAGGGPPVVALETGTPSAPDLYGAPHDVAVSPDGGYCAVRSELGAGGYDLTGPAPTQVFNRRLSDAPGPFGNAPMDSIELSDARVATISRQSNPSFPQGTQVDVFDLAGNRAVDRIPGDPHDLAIDETGRYLVVRTSSRLCVYDLAAWSPGAPLAPADITPTPVATHTSYGAGLDSLALHGTRAVSLHRVGLNTRVLIHDFAGGQLRILGVHTLSDRPLDVAITPNGRRCVVSGLASVEVLDMNTAELLLRNELGSDGWWPWCDGVVVNDARALAFGILSGSFLGWASVIDLFDDPVSYCTAGANSVGAGAEIYASGSNGLAAGDLVLWAAQLPADVPAQFFYGPSQASTPLGDGTLCVGGALARFPLGASGAGGVTTLAVDYANLPGGAITAGSTWNFQLFYRDVAAGGSGFNLTDGVAIPFVH